MIKEFLKKPVVSYSALIIAGVTGYTNLMKDFGELEATVNFQDTRIQELKSAIDKTTIVYSALKEDYIKLKSSKTCLKEH